MLFLKIKNFKDYDFKDQTMINYITIKDFLI
jgi:hypothetical protein